MVIVRRLAPTDIAAFHIHSSTYHSALGISPKEKCKDTRRTIRRMERNGENIKKDERKENNKEGGEVASENLGKEDGEGKRRRTVRRGVSEEGRGKM